MKESLTRLLDWIDSNGGPQAVAPVIGKSPQTFYNYRNRGSLPNMEIFELLASRFPDFDANYILKGLHPAKPAKQTPAKRQGFVYKIRTTLKLQ